MKKTVYLLGISIAGTICCQAEVKKDGLLFVMPLTKNLESISADGASKNNAKFTRKSAAGLQDFSQVKNDVPRYYDINGNRGLLMENGSNAWRHTARGTNNFFPAATASCDTPEALKTLNGAKINITKGIQNDKALEIIPQKAGDCATAVGEIKTGESYIASIYAVGPAKIQVSITTIHKDGSKVTRKNGTFNLNQTWQRCHILFNDPKVKVTTYDKSANPAVKAEITFKSLDGKPFKVDALMLEQCGMYMNRIDPSTWIPGSTKRMTEILLVPMPETQLNSGTVTLRFVPLARGNWSSLIHSGSGWKPVLSISTQRHSSRIAVQAFGTKFYKDYKMPIGKPVYIAVTWSNGTVALYADGKKLTESKIKAIKALDKNLSIGGTPDNTSPNNKADGLISDVSVWKRALTPEEVKELSGKDAAKVLNLSGGLTLMTPCKVFARDTALARMDWKLEKKTSDRATVSVSGHNKQPLQIRNGRLNYSFSPARLMPGKYKVQVVLPGKTFNFPIEIVPARIPWNNFQVCAWNSSGDFAATGITIAGLWISTPNDVDQNTSRGMYSEENIVFMGNPRSSNHRSDWGIDRHGKLIYADIQSPYVRKSVETAGDKFAEDLKDMPDIKAVILNTERHAGSYRFSFSPRAVSIAKDKFGLDLNLWKNSPKSDYHVINPGGRLKTKIAPQYIPENRIIPLNNPIYAFHLWWHSANGASDVITNELLAEKILKTRPDILIMREPFLRRPAVISYSKINVAQDWLYYADPKNVLLTNENLNRAVRDYPHMSASTMPQFLLKPDMAAPFAGMPSADMFKEACYLVASRPARVTTFWNFPAILNKKKQLTSVEIEKKLGGTPDWQKTKQIIKQKKLAIFAWDPKLQPAFKEISETLWKPMGALLPKWRSTPRRIAVINSFASHIFSDTRWSKISPMQRQLLSMGIPYDILVDQDFTRPFKQKYDVIMFPDCFAMTEPTFAYLKKFIANGGTVLVDEQCKVNLPGAIKIEMADKTDTSGLRKQELDLLRKYHNRTEHPQFVEAMEALSQQKMSQSENKQLTSLLLEKLKLPVICRTKAVCWNMLEANGAEYLFAVNDLRVPGPMYGRYGKALEKGISQTAEFEYKGEARYAYDLLNHKSIPLRNGKFKLQLKPCSGSIVMFTEQPVSGLQVNTGNNVVQGQNVEVKISMPKLNQGLIPVELSLILPNGKKSSLSRYDVIEAGKLRYSIPIAHNAPTGKWQLKITELAAGTKRSIYFTVNGK